MIDLVSPPSASKSAPRTRTRDGASSEGVTAEAVRGDEANLLRPWVERALPIGFLALAAVFVPVLVFQPEGLPRLHALERELTDVKAENAELERSIAKLHAEVRALRADPAAVERIARDQLGLVRKSEIVFHFAQTPSAPSTRGN